MDLAPDQGILDECMAKGKEGCSCQEAMEQDKGPHRCNVPFLGQDRLGHEWAFRSGRRPRGGEADV
eukprot:10295351-Heterocapsa_arctica.AAC.1